MDKQAKEFGDMMGDLLKTAKKDLQAARDMVKMAKPNKQKNIPVDLPEGTENCVMQLFDDRVVIIFPTKDSTKAFYDRW